MSGTIEVLSVAPQFGSGPIPFAGHEESYQLGLAAAAASVGIPWTVLVPVHSAVQTPVTVACLDPDGPHRIAGGVDRHLAGRDASTDRTTCVVVYEGHVDLASAIARVARAHPTVRFLVNLFHSEAGLEAPVVRRRSDAVTPELAPFAPGALAERLRPIRKIDWPDNLAITAETEQKALMARSVGIPVAGVWHLHSQMADSPMPAVTALEPARAEAAGAGHRPVVVLLGLRSSHLHPPIVRDVIDVIEGVRRTDPGASVRWVMSGRFDTDLRTRMALRRLGRAGVDLSATAHDGPLADDDYARQFLEVDALWMPMAWPYRVQSSGKALDALVLGCPVIAPAGTAGARAMERWVPGAPAYGSTTEASQLFLRLPTLIGTLRGELAASSAAMRAAYSAETTVRWVVEQLTVAYVRGASVGVGDTGAALRGDADIALPPTVTAPSLASRVVGRLRREGASIVRMAGALPRGLAAFRRELLERR